MVLDEVQSLPDRLLVPILSVLRDLCENYGTTVLLASATQPEFTSVSSYAGVAQHEVIADPAPFYEQLRRVSYEWRMEPKPKLADIARDAAEYDHVLIVVNTTKNSAEIHRELEDRWHGDADQVFHLSTRMAPVHRRQVLDHVWTRAALVAGGGLAILGWPESRPPQDPSVHEQAARYVAILGWPGGHPPPCG
ncbi:hypothetical protein ACPA54_34670 [Uniformispora flossi]|uniref:hypothetical protein n=1 Tax=Uniformispora flossi TaxID=3390723 RepID=UPI003C2C614B